MFDFSYERTLKSVDESLARMGLDYIDLIQVHDMEFAPSPEIIINETLPGTPQRKRFYPSLSLQPSRRSRRKAR